MYRILFYEETVSSMTNYDTIYDPAIDYCVISATLKKEIGQPDELVFEIPYNHKNYDKINKNCTVEVFSDYTEGELMFKGRPIDITIDFERTKKVTCEGCLAFLCDIYHEPFSYTSADDVEEPKAFLQKVIDWYNDDCQVRTREFKLGNVYIYDSNNYISRSSEEPMRIIDILSEKCINDTFGGYFVARPYPMGTAVYLDYVTGPEIEADQTIEFGANLLDVAQSVEYNDFCTMLLPLGASEMVNDSSGNQTKKYVTIESVNPHKSESGWSGYSNIRKMCLTNNDMMNTYGEIMKKVEWDDVTEPSILLIKAQEYMESLSPSIASMTVKAIDLSLMDSDIPSLKTGYRVHVISEKHGIDQIIGIYELEYDLLNPENNVITLGSTTEGIAASSISTSRKLSSTENSVSNIEEIVSNLGTINHVAGTYKTAEWTEGECTCSLTLEDAGVYIVYGYFFLDDDTSTSITLDHYAQYTIHTDNEGATGQYPGACGYYDASPITATNRAVRRGRTISQVIVTTADNVTLHPYVHTATVGIVYKVRLTSLRIK